MSTRIGTCHFVTFNAAVRYYMPYGYNSADVNRKLAAGEIAIGRPEGRGVRLDSDGRYSRDA